MPVLTSADWDDFLNSYPDAHILQTSAWGTLKSSFGWDVCRVTAGDNGAQILFRTLPLGLCFAYLPKGPVAISLDSIDEFWPEVDALCRERKAIFLKIECDCWHEEGEFFFRSALKSEFRLSTHEIQPSRTLVVDLTPEEDQILATMKQKTRYNIRLAARKGVVVRASDDVSVFSELMDITGQRDEFGVHSIDYYRQAYNLFYPQKGCELFLAEYEDQPLAAIMVFVHGTRAWYFYGASSNQHRNRMPTYLLQWEAMRWAKAHGCQTYDLWGVPDLDHETLEANFMKRHDGLWGVYRFKRGFGGQLKRSSPVWDRIYRPVLYSAYRLLLRRLF